jgi:hypothetical protein
VHGKCVIASTISLNLNRTVWLFILLSSKTLYIFSRWPLPRKTLKIGYQVAITHFPCTNIIVPLTEIFEGTTVPSKNFCTPKLVEMYTQMKIAVGMLGIFEPSSIIKIMNSIKKG